MLISRLCIISCLALFFSLSLSQSTSYDEIEALEQIYTTMGGEYWYNSKNWMNGEDPCSTTEQWYGLQCFYVTKNQTSVLSISLSVNNLTGSIPQNITALNNLAYLFLSNNAIVGTLPEFLFTSIPLQELILGSNLLTGTIPDAISNLARTLTYLDMQSNTLQGTIPESFYSLNLLTGLLLNGNKYNQNAGFSGSISESISNLTSLKTFNIDGNSMSGNLPDGLWSLYSLTQLFLGYNQFQGTISPEIGNLSALQLLEISSTKINGPIPESVYNLKSLQYLNLGLNQLNGTISNSIGELQQLTQLNLQSLSANKQNRFTGSIPDSLWNITTLQYLYISYNSLTGSLPSSINKISNLITLDVGQNEMDGTIPDSLFQLQSLGTLYLQQNQFSGTLNGDLFEQLTNLNNLLLSSNQLSGEIPSAFFANYSLSGTAVLSDNPFLCPVPDFATAPPLSATCQYWLLSGISPTFGSTEGGDLVTVSGSGFTNLDNIYCSFSNTTEKISTSTSLATVINSTTLTCFTPPHSPTHKFSNFGISIWYNDPQNVGPILTTSPSTPPVHFVYETISRSRDI